MLDLEQQCKSQVSKYSKCFLKSPLAWKKESMVEVKPKPQCSHTHLQQICIILQLGQVHGATESRA